MLAVKWLAGGASIQQVAGDLGYESVPSFVTMFRKALGTSPGRYMAQRHAAGLRAKDRSCDFRRCLRASRFRAFRIENDPAIGDAR